MATQVSNDARFIRNVVHDLRAPVRSVVQFATVLEQHVDEAGELAPMLNRVITAAMQLDVMICGLRRFHEAIGIPGADLPLRTVIERAIEAYSSRGPKIEIDDGDATPVPTAIGIVLGNLIDNAAKYGASTIHVCARVERENVVVEVRDDGIGFDPEAAEQIFFPWKRTPEARARADGEGMGLAICRELIETIGGRIWAESGGRNTGATFRIAVPLEVPRRPETGKANILVVDDEPIVRATLRRWLRPWGDVFEAENWSLGRVSVQRRSFDLIFIDLKLGDGNGTELVQEIRERSVNLSCPVIIMSGYFAPGEGLREAQRCKANGALPKPFFYPHVSEVAIKFLGQPQG